MRSVLVILFVSCIGITSPGQISAPDLPVTKKRFLKFDSAYYSTSIKLPFDRIEILDYRYDTSKLGYVAWKNDTKLTVEDGLQNGLGHYLNNYFRKNFESSSDRSLLIVLKQLWLEYGVTNQILRSKRIDFSSVMAYQPKNTICIANMDVFAATGGTYQALTRIEYSFSIEKDDTRDDLSLLLLPFDSLMKNLGSLDIQKVVSQKKSFSISEIHSGYQKRFDLPILTEKRPVKGIYVSFDDFKNNKISYPEFRTKKTKHSVDVLIKQNGKEVILIEYWGFFDGKDFYIKPDLVPFKAVRQGNSFDLYANFRNENYNYPIKTRNQLALLTVDRNYTYIAAYPVQVDMETGKLH